MSASIRFSESILLELHILLRYNSLLNFTAELLELREKEMLKPKAVVVLCFLAAFPMVKMGTTTHTKHFSD
ncbi:MAG: hypothetical protein ACUVRP_07705 [Chlorobiales bacterium]